MTTIVPFDESHIHLFTSWFNALPRNNVWTDAWTRSRSIDDASYRPDLMIAALQGEEPVGFLLGSIAEGKGWIKAFLVRPDRQRQGICAAMFEHIERAFEEQGVQEIIVGWAPPRYLLPGVDISYTSAIVFLDRRGYQTTRETRVNKDVVIRDRDWSTADQENRLLEQGFTIRRGRAEDQSGLRHLCETHNSLVWAIETEMALQRDPITLFVAEQEGTICAFAAHSVAGPIHFGPMLTAPHLRGAGIGSVLLKRCLRDWQNAGCERCEIVWAGPLSFYARTVGATMGRAFWVYGKSL